MNNVLLLTDFSLKSENAHQYALEFFRGQEITFHLLSIQKIWEYTMDDLMVAPPKSSVDEALLGDNRLMVTEAISQLKESCGDSHFSFNGIVNYAVFTEAITQAIAEFDIELIVVGTDGKTGIIEAIFSSHTLRIIRKVDCPVLIVPKHISFEKPIRVQYLLDYDDSFELCGKELLVEIVAKYQSVIEVLRLTFGQNMRNSGFKEERQKIQSFFPAHKLFYHTSVDRDPMAAIHTALKEVPSQLQVLSAHKRTFLERIFSNSHLSKIVNSVTIPLLILRDCNQ